VILQGLTPKTLLAMNERRHSCEVVKWHLTFSSNHLSTLGACKDFVKNTLSTYKATQIEELQLLVDQEMVWVIDC
jgi:hypothetical protein